METIFVTTGQGEQQGPYTAEQVGTMWRAGQLPQGSLYWSQGMADWRPIHELPGLAPLPQIGVAGPSFFGGAPTPGEIRHSYLHNPTGLTRALVVLLGVYATFSALSIVGSLWDYQTYGGKGSGSSTNLSASDIFQGFVGIASFGVFVATAIVFGRWIYRAGVNLRGFGATGFENTPGWSVGWYFIPVANLYKPFQAMKEIWMASAAPRNWQGMTQKTPEVLGFWWALWLISNWVEQLALRGTMGASPLFTGSVATTLSILGNVLDIPLSYVAIRLVTSIQKMQDDWVNSPLGGDSY